MERFGERGTVDELRSMVAELEHDRTVCSILIFACDANGFSPDELDPLLKETDLTVFGGVFPEVIYHGKNYGQGTLVVGLSQRPEILVIPGLSDPDVDYEAVIDELHDASLLTHTMFVWVDGLSSRISALIESLFSIFGLDQNYIGGGARLPQLRAEAVPIHQRGARRGLCCAGVDQYREWYRCESWMGVD